MKIRKAVVILTSAFMVLASVHSYAAFAKSKDYPEGKFADVPNSVWFSADVKSAYELGFVEGTDEKQYSPDGTMTVAQGITLACRLNSIYNNKTISEVAGGNWYDMYVQYAIDNSIINANQFDSYDRELLRHEMATLFVKCLPDGYYTAQNDVTGIPDVSKDEAYYSDLLTLYNAGVVMGSDDYGTFRPDSSIKRSEVAAIVNRAAVPQNRLKKTLLKYTDRQGYVLCQNDTYTSKQLGISSGWVYDNRGGGVVTTLNYDYNILHDVRNDLGTAMIRQFNDFDTGCVMLETSVKVGDDGFSLEYRDAKNELVYQVKTIDKSWKLLCSDGSYKTVAQDVLKTQNSFTFRIIVDLDKKISTTYLNDVNCGNGELLSDNIMSFCFATDKEHTLTASYGKINIVVNYPMYEDFEIIQAKASYGWSLSEKASSSGGELVLGADSSAVKTFEKADGKLIAETYFISPDGKDFSYDLTSSGNTVISVGQKNGKLVASGKELYTLTKNMWYRLRLETDTDAGKTDVYLNGRKVGAVDSAAAKYVDGVCVSSRDGEVRFDNMKLSFNMEYSDYCPAPATKASDDDYIVGINVCPLWQNGTHYGWACITPYDEPKPLIGYYDEGNPETADWEIKFMAEHGIDFQAFCWFADVSTGPLKTPKYSSQFHDGYMYAKYSDSMSYCLLWELANGMSFNAEQFRNYVVPYWFENYFLDDRYMKIDNKLIICMFGGSRLADKSYFGSADGAKKEIEYLNDVAKSYGFDGVVFISNGTASNLIANGIDATYAYHWGDKSNTIDANTQGILRTADLEGLYTVPTTSVGYDCMPWYGVRNGSMTLEDYKTLNTWVTDTYLPKYAQKGTWNEKLVMLSTWNEYGEGTYIMPAGLNGFGYLDTLRSVYTDLDDEHTDVLPNENQKKRINHLYPQYARVLAGQGWYDTEKASLASDPITYDTVFDWTVSKDNSTCISVAEPTFDENGVTATSTTTDPVVLRKGEIRIDVTNAAVIKVVMKAPKGLGVTIFYSTVEDPKMNESKTLKFVTDSDELREYTIDVSKDDKFTGKLLSLRFDPMSKADTEFTFKSLTVLKKSKDSIEPLLLVNDVKVEIKYPAEKKGDDRLFTFDPTTGVHQMLNSLYTWNKDKGTLKIEANNHTVAYEVGSDKYSVDGIENPLGYTLQLVDGLPRISFVQLAEGLGYTAQITDGNVYVRTANYELAKELESEKVEGSWEFNGLDTEGWTSSQMSLSCNFTGYLSMISKDTYKDPIMLYGNELSLNAAKYTKLEMKVRFSYEGSTPNTQGATFYYITDKDKTWNEAKTISMHLPGGSSNGEWVTLTYDLTTKEEWKNNIIRLRFDPFNAYGTMDIDYIRFIADEAYVEGEEEPYIFKVENGDAEQSTHKFYSKNAEISIATDPDNTSNHAYLVKAGEKKAWSYIRYPAQYTQGKTYTVEFDARLVGTSDGETEVETSVSCNFVYPDETNSRGSDHVIGGKKMAVKDGWVHYSYTHTVNFISDENGHEFTFYADPAGEKAVSFMVDNIVVTQLD